MPQADGRSRREGFHHLRHVQEVEHPLQIAGQHGQAELAAHLPQALEQEVALFRYHATSWNGPAFGMAAAYGTTAVASISTSASFSISPFTSTTDIAGKCAPKTSRYAAPMAGRAAT